MHLGVILPNFGDRSSVDRIRGVAELAEELGFDSVWATEHVLVGSEDAAEPYRRVYDPFVTLGWLAALTERVALGTSIVVVPLHDPIHLAKQAATLQELSRGRLKLGVGMGWYEPEFRMLGVPFEGRGRRGNEALRLMRALWSGATSFEGETWAFANASFAPLPDPAPEIWVGGSSPPAVRRALELGDVWHPSRGSEVEHVRRVKERHPELRIVPRTRPELADGMLEAGAEGVVLTFSGGESQMRDLAARYR